MQFFHIDPFQCRHREVLVSSQCPRHLSVVKFCHLSFAEFSVVLVGEELELSSSCTSDFLIKCLICLWLCSALIMVSLWLLVSDVSCLWMDLVLVLRLLMGMIFSIVLVIWIVFLNSFLIVEKSGKGREFWFRIEPIWGFIWVSMDLIEALSWVSRKGHWRLQ